MSPLEKINHLLHEAVWTYLRPYWRIHILLGVAIIVTVSFEVCVPLMIKYLIDKALIPHRSAELVTALIVFILLFAFSAIARYMLVIIKAYILAELNFDLRAEMICIIKRLPIRYFDQISSNYFSPLWGTELPALAKTFQNLFAVGFYSILKLVVILVTLFHLDWQLATAVILILPFMALWPRRQLKSTVSAVAQSKSTLEHTHNSVKEYVFSQMLIRAFGLGEVASRRLIEEVSRKGFRGKLKRYSDLRRVLQSSPYLMETFKLSMDNQQAILRLLVIGIGAWLSFMGLLSLGTFSAFILLLPGLMGALGQIGDYVQELSRATLSLDRFEQVKFHASPQSGNEKEMTLQSPLHSIRFEHVSFSYEKKSPSLSNVSFTLSVGHSIAFVGRSGSGKSTLFKLLLGLYPPSSGRVLIDDNDLQQIEPRSWGAQIGTVLQQSILLNTTIRNNICFAKPDASDEEIIQAARLAEIHDYIMGLPQGYQSGVGEGGKWLSEGQKQRIALARALLPDPSVLLLDEVTASLDPESEAAINATIQRLARRRTVIVVTHRLASIVFVNHIAVVDQGQITEQGRHDELLFQRGLYCKLWQMQSGFIISADGHRAEVQAERLQTIALFRQVDIASLEKLADQFVSEFFQPEQSIYEQGQEGDKFFIIVRGTISMSTYDAANHSIRLADLQDGDYFGEVEMLSRARRTTTVRTKTPSLVLTLHAHHFHNMMKELSSINKVIIQMALGRSLSTICSVGRRRHTDAVWQEILDLKKNESY